MNTGVFGILGAAVLWGCIGVLSFGLFELGITPWEVAFWRAALSTGGLLIYLAIRHPEQLRPPPGHDLLLLTAYGAVGVGLFYISFQLANYLTSVAVAVVLLYTAPVFVMLGAHFLLGERLNGAKLSVAALVMAGVAATALGAAEAEVRVTFGGIVWGVLAALSYSAYYLFGRRYLPRFGITRTLLFSLLSGTLVLGVASVIAGHPPRVSIAPAAWPLLSTLALGTTLLANLLYYWGLQRLEAGKAAVIASVEPVVAALLALVLFDQRLTQVGWIGVLLVVIGAAIAPYLGRVPRRPPQARPVDEASDPRTAQRLR